MKVDTQRPVAGGRGDGSAGWGVIVASLVAWAALALAPSALLAQQQRMQEMVDEATDHYDMLEIDKAEGKLQQAIDLGEDEGVEGEALARAYMMLGVVRYGADKDKQAALAQFEKAAAEDADVSLPDVYATPTLEEAMEEAHASVETPPEPSGQQESVDDAEQVDEFTHEPVASARAGEPLTIEASVPPDLSVETVYVKFRRYDQDDWQRVDLEAADATQFAAEIEGDRVYTSQVAYYLKAVDAAGEVQASSGSDDEPHTITILGSSDFEPERAGGDGEDEGAGDEESDRASAETDTGDGEPSGKSASRSAYIDVGGGTAAGFLPGGRPTANPDHDVSAGLAPAFGHLRLGGGAMLSERASLGLYIRWQFAPGQDFEAIRRRNQSQAYEGFRDGECLGTGVPGDCLIGLKYRWFFTDTSDLGVYSSFGGGVGRTRHWLRLKEQASTAFCADRETHQQAQGGEYCYRRDTVRPGWMHFGAGGGVTYQLNDSVALMGEAYLQVLFPDAAINLDLNVGPQFRF